MRIVKQLRLYADWIVEATELHSRKGIAWYKPRTLALFGLYFTSLMVTYGFLLLSSKATEHISIWFAPLIIVFFFWFIFLLVMMLYDCVLVPSRKDLWDYMKSKERKGTR